MRRCFAEREKPPPPSHLKRCLRGVGLKWGVSEEIYTCRLGRMDFVVVANR
jgi:hypothetical protein